MIGVFCSRKKPLPTDVRKVICIDTRGATSKLVLLETYTVIQYYRGGNGNLLGYYLKEIPDFGFSLMYYFKNNIQKALINDR